MCLKLKTFIQNIKNITKLKKKSDLILKILKIHLSISEYDLQKLYMLIKNVYVYVLIKKGSNSDKGVTRVI